jgi:glycosyltransferase involved in cell wall biosynthesis
MPHHDRTAGANVEARRRSSGRKPRIAIVRGATLNHWEMQSYAGLTSSFDVTAFGSDRGSFDRDRMPFSVRTLPGLLHCAERTPLVRRWYRDRYEHNEVMLGLGYALRDFDLIHTAETFNPYSLQALRATRHRGVPLVVSVAENVPGKFDEFPRLRAARRQVAATADLFLALTERNRQWLLLEGAAPEKIIIHPTGVDRTRFYPAPPDAALQAALGLTSQHLVVVTIGTLQWEKGYFELLAAATLLRADPAIGPRLRYVWVGRGPEQTALERQVQEQGLADVIRIVPYVPYEHVPRYHRLADVFCLPSNPTRWIREQFGMVLVEAMACGKAVVGACVGGIPEVIGDAGTLTPPADFVGLAATLKPLLLSAERRSILGELGRQRVEQHYDAAKLVDRLADQYARLLEGRAAC